MCDPIVMFAATAFQAYAQYQQGQAAAKAEMVTARNNATGDGGMWQFNDATYVWLTGHDHAERDHVATQHAMFVRLWDNGKGWRHWRSSQRCWSQWLDIVDGVAVWKGK